MIGPCSFSMGLHGGGLPCALTAVPNVFPQPSSWASTEFEFPKGQHLGVGVICQMVCLYCFTEAGLHTKLWLLANAFSKKLNIFLIYIFSAYFLYTHIYICRTIRLPPGKPWSRLGVLGLGDVTLGSRGGSVECELFPMSPKRRSPEGTSWKQALGSHWAAGHWGLRIRCSKEPSGQQSGVMSTKTSYRVVLPPKKSLNLQCSELEKPFCHSLLTSSSG